MAIIKTEGIVIRIQDYRESSKIVTCFTPDHGKISLIAKGAKRVKSRMGGTLDLLQHIAIVYYQKETRDIQTLSQSELLHSFQAFQNDLQKLSYGLAVLELIQKLEIAKEPNPLLFKQTLETLMGIEKTTIPELVLYQFVWRWLKSAGFHPKLRRCLKCSQVPGSGYVRFLITHGGYYCSNCSVSVENSMEISLKCVKLLLYLRENNTQRIAGLNISTSLVSELRDLSWRFLRYHSDERGDLKSLDFFKRIKNNKIEFKMNRRKLIEEKE